MKHVWVKYKTGSEDIIHQEMFENLLARGYVAQFYRCSETRWITPGVDRVRGTAGRYAGPERRNIQCPQIVVSSQAGSGQNGLSL